MKWAEVCTIGLSLPEAVEDIWFRTPALKVHKKAFVRLKEDGDSVVFILESVDEQEFLLAARPDIYFITDHYRGYPAILARLATLTPAECRLRLENGWKLRAPKRLLQKTKPAPTKSSTRKRQGT